MIPTYVPTVLPHGLGATQPRAVEPVDDIVETFTPVIGERVEYRAPCPECGLDAWWVTESFEHKSKANGTTKVSRSECCCACAFTLEGVA